jgi:hypothetical protein
MSVRVGIGGWEGGFGLGFGMLGLGLLVSTVVGLGLDGGMKYAYIFSQTIYLRKNAMFTVYPLVMVIFTKNNPPLRVGMDLTVPLRMGTLATTGLLLTMANACCITS